MCSLESKARRVLFPNIGLVEECPPKPRFSYISIGSAVSNNNGLSSRHKSNVASEGRVNW